MKKTPLISSLRFRNMAVAVFLATTTLMISCKSKSGHKESEATDSTKSSEVVAETIQKTEAKKFDVNSVSISDKPLGAFPYFTLPEGYKNYTTHTVVDFDRIFYWVGDHFEKPEGKIFFNRITAKEGKSYSDLELSKNLDEVITGVGGVKVFEGKVPADSSSIIPSNNQITYMDGYGFISNAPSTVYLIRRADKNIWVQLTPTDDGVSACWMILETKPLKITASLIKADEMKKELDAKGHIALYVNFDTDKASIKAESKPVIDEIQKLLTSNPALKIKIEGHTDNSGTAAHNLKLSEERAQSVKSALTTGGINVSRLQSAGLGQTKPLADNATEEGKAQNRRVEIVKV